MKIRTAIAVLGAAAILAPLAHAHESQSGSETEPPAPRITMGNGERNSIEINGLLKAEGVTNFSEVRVDGEAVSSFRGDSVALIFPKITVEQPSFVVLHPVMDGRPNGDVVSGFAYVDGGTTENVTVRLNTPADAGRKFLVMLHKDVDDDRVLDFVFVEDGINVEDTAVFEGTRMVAHIVAVPE